MLSVRHEDRDVARITTQGGDATLTYTEEWHRASDHFPISLTMPVDHASFPAKIVLPWLMNVLPEGEPLRAMSRAAGAAPEDVLQLLAETGSDLAGALSIGPSPRSGPQKHVPISDEVALERIIADLPARPFLIGDEGVSMSLAGAQEKLPVTFDGKRLAIPVNGAASTHILKPDNERLPNSVQNEALCMVLARRAGLDVAPVTTGRAAARTYLLVTRYDRAEHGGDVIRIHQEDFCQALGRSPAAKYEFNQTGRGGPSLAEMFDLVRRHMTALDITRLLDAVIFNIAIGNVDSHAKNYSILLRPDGSRLAPLYDLMSGLDWSGITENHAQAIGGQRRGRHIYGRHWRRLAQACGLGPTGTVRRVQEVAARLKRELPAAVEQVTAMPAGPGYLLETFAASISERADLVGAHAGQEGPAHLPDSSTDPIDPSADATAYH